MKMFNNVESKVVNELRKKDERLRERLQKGEEENIDNLINNVEMEIQENN